MKVHIEIIVNNDLYSLEVKPTMSLLELLRDELGLTGTKCGCNRGECGACTVILNGKSVNSCLVLAPECDRVEVLTIEGLRENSKSEISPDLSGDRLHPKSHPDPELVSGVSGSRLHPVQQAFIDEGAIQCGFCTPGMIMQAVAFLNENPNPDEEAVRAGIQGNICRCTGYEKIIKAVLKADKIWKRNLNT